jgi:hypothetical protein
MIFVLKLKNLRTEGGQKEGSVRLYLARTLGSHEVQELRSRAPVGTGRTPRAGKTG